jgi:hypothetical protein
LLDQAKAVWEQEGSRFWIESQSNESAELFYELSIGNHAGLRIAAKEEGVVSDLISVLLYPFILRTVF